MFHVFLKAREVHKERDSYFHICFLKEKALTECLFLAQKRKPVRPSVLRALQPLPPSPIYRNTHLLNSALTYHVIFPFYKQQQQHSFSSLLSQQPRSASEPQALGTEEVRIKEYFLLPGAS